MAKFKVGDRVRQATANYLPKGWLGRVGTVVRIEHRVGGLYEVAFDFETDELYFRMESELELVEEPKKQNILQEVVAEEIEFEPVGTLPIAGDEVYFIWHGAPEFHGEVDYISEEGAIYTDGGFDPLEAFSDSETSGYQLRIQKRGKPKQNIPQPKQNILQEADSLAAGDRGADYGHPDDDYAKTGMIWGALLHKWSKESAASNYPIPVPPELACLMMVGVKLSREVNKHKRDNLVDGCGYFRCVEMIHERKGE